MSADPLVLLGEVDRATSRLLATAAAPDGDPTAPSLLPGWSRGHVLSHVARNADGLEGVSLTVRPDSLGHVVPVGDGGPPEVRGPAHELAAWLAGRSPGTGLAIEPPGALPTIPAWR